MLLEWLGGRSHHAGARGGGDEVGKGVITGRQCRTLRGRGACIPLRMFTMATHQNRMPRVNVPMLSDPEGLDRTLGPDGLDRR